MILVDMIGPSNLRIKHDTGSTPWLVDLIWATAARLGYANVFVNLGFRLVSMTIFHSFSEASLGATSSTSMFGDTYWHTHRIPGIKLTHAVSASSVTFSSRLDPR
jgi:hypothetical protein